MHVCVCQVMVVDIKHRGRGRGLSHFALSGRLAYWGPAGVGQAVLDVALGGHGWGGQGGYGGALGGLLLEELLRLAVVQRGAAGLQGHGVGAHAGVQAASGGLDLFQVVPVKLVVGQEAHSLHDADLLLGVASIDSTLNRIINISVIIGGKRFTELWKTVKYDLRLRWGLKVWV